VSPALGKTTFRAKQHAQNVVLPTEAGLENTTSFLFQPEVLLLYDLLTFDLDKTREFWMKNYPESELERIANAFGISLD
jgi:hypothetical protein